jgi:hypothetical protein
VEQPEGPGGSGRLIERRFGLWRWKTWARENVIACRLRSGWSLRRSGALIATRDALDDYKLWTDQWYSTGLAQAIPKTLAARLRRRTESDRRRSLL